MTSRISAPGRVWLTAAGLLAVVVVAAGSTAITTALGDAAGVTVLRPSSGLLVGILVCCRTRSRYAATLTAMGLALVGFAAWRSQLSITAVLVAASAVLAIWVTTEILRWAGQRAGAREGLAGVGALLIAGVAGGTVTAVATAVRVAPAGVDTPLWSSVLAGSGFFASVLVLTPLSVAVANRGRRFERPDGGFAELLVQSTLLLVSVLVILGPMQQYPLSFLPLPVMLWGALRLGVLVSHVQTLLVAIAIVLATVGGIGPFAPAAGSSPQDGCSPSG